VGGNQKITNGSMEGLAGKTICELAERALEALLRTSTGHSEASLLEFAFGDSRGHSEALGDGIPHFTGLNQDVQKIDQFFAFEHVTSG
jgi:hypothetical protein